MSNTEDTTKLIEQITHPKKLLFLENYPKFIHTVTTARAISVDESTVYRWFDSDEVFTQAFQVIKKKIERNRLEELEKELHKRALDKSDLLLMFSVKKLDPSYREKTETHITGDIVFKSHIPDHREIAPGSPQMAIEAPKQLKEGKATEQS